MVKYFEITDEEQTKTMFDNIISQQGHNLTPEQREMINNLYKFTKILTSQGLNLMSEFKNYQLRFIEEHPEIVNKGSEFIHKIICNGMVNIALNVIINELNNDGLKAISKNLRDISNNRKE